MLSQKDLYPDLVVVNATKHSNSPVETKVNARYRFDLLQRALDLMNSDEVRIINTKYFRPLPLDLTAFRNTCYKLQAEIRNETPDVAPALEPRWEKLSVVLDVYSNAMGVVALLRPVAHNGSIYVAGLCKEYKEGSPPRYTLRLLHLNPDRQGMPPSTAVEIPSPDTVTAPNLRPDAYRLEMFAGFSFIHDGCYFLGSQNNGVYVMPLDGSRPEHITTADGLPSNRVRGMTGMGNRLYLCMGDTEATYIVSWDLKARKCDILASTVRKEKLSPFDNTSHIICRVIRADPVRERIVLVITSFARTAITEFNGIWAFEPENGRFKQLMAFRSYDINNDGHIEGNYLYLNSFSGTYVYDLAKNDQVLVYDGKFEFTGDDQCALASPVEKGIELQLQRERFRLRSPAASHAGRLGLGSEAVLAPAACGWQSRNASTTTSRSDRVQTAEY